jgi:hypothetical protein
VISPDRGEGQRWAREELAHSEYARARPTLFQRAVNWLLDHIDSLAANTGLGAGQLIALVVTVAVVVVVALVLLRRTVRLRVAADERAGADVLAGSTLTGAEHRARAAAALAAGQYDVAVRESMRAVARRLDERALLDPRPGRTADEIAVEAARLLPELAAELREGARVFDDVAYGSVRADAARAERMRRLDERVEAAKPVVLAGFAVS